MNKKSRGFTLIELLAVIVVLAIIAVITTPIVIGVINDTKEATFKNSLQGVFKAVDLYTIKEEGNKIPVEGLSIKDNNIKLSKNNIPHGQNDARITE